MTFDANHVVDLPAVSVKLAFTIRGGGDFEGTGFCVEHRGRAWLITCRHNVEDREYDFLGVNDLASMRLIGESEIDFDDQRRVVGISVDGFIPDCAAIELRAGEWSHTPKFSTDLLMTMEGWGLPETIEVRAPPPVPHTVKLKPTGWVMFQGFPGGQDDAVTLRGVRIVALPTIIQPWMLSYMPACVKGFSGGPILGLERHSVVLLGITTHRFDATFQVPMEDGRRAEITLPASAGVPIAPLLWALDRAGAGASVIPVPDPQFPL